MVVTLTSAAAAQTQPADAAAAALRARDFAQAVEQSAVALKRAPADPRLWTMNGVAQAGLGKRDEALRSFQRALAIDPRPAEAPGGRA